MRAQTSVAFVSFLIASVAIGLYQLETHSLNSKKAAAFYRSLTHSHSINYLCHRGSGRIDDRLAVPQIVHA